MLLPNSASRPHFSVQQPTGEAVPLSAWREYGYWARPVIGGVEVRNSDSTLCPVPFSRARLTAHADSARRSPARSRVTRCGRKRSFHQPERDQRLTSSRELGARALPPFATSETVVLENARDRRTATGALGMPSQPVFGAREHRFANPLLRCQAGGRIDNIRDRRRPPRPSGELEPLSARHIPVRYRGQRSIFQLIVSEAE
jgi:hypothetical protein